MNNTFLIIDSFEGQFALCEDDKRNIINIPKSLLPKDICEGDCIRCVDGIYIIDEKLTSKRRDEAIALTKKLMK